VLATAPRSSPFLLASMLTMSPTLEIRPLHPAWHAHQCHGSRDLNLQGMDVAAFQIPWDPAVSLSFPHLSSLLSSQIQWDPSMQICFGFDFIILTSSSLSRHGFFRLGILNCKGLHFFWQPKAYCLTYIVLVIVIV
jgi:hypothetical protein